MQIDKPFLQVLVTKKAESTVNKSVVDNNTPVLVGSNAIAASQRKEINIVSSEIIDEIIEQNKGATIYSIADKIAAKPVSTAGPTNRKPIDIIKSDLSASVSAYTTTTFSDNQIRHIKQVIYDLHHPKKAGEEPGTGESGNPGGNTGDIPGTGEGENPGGVTGDTPELEEPDSSKKSFIRDFNDTTTMFAYLGTIDSSITPENGLTRAQLIALTQRDNWEDANKDFFGTLNRAFDGIDKDKDGKLSFNELKAYIGNEIGDYATAQYKSKVEAYCADLQNQYSRLGGQAKLEFAIDITKQYLKAAGLTLQLEALERLINLPADTYSPIHCGQIAIANLNEWDTNQNGICDPSERGNVTKDNASFNDSNNNGVLDAGETVYTTLGAYASHAWSYDYSHNGVSNHDVSVYYSDVDSVTGTDSGITLNITYLNANWEELVDTLVHELTHATKALYYDRNGNGVLAKDAIDKLEKHTNIDNTNLSKLRNHWAAWESMKFKDVLARRSADASPQEWVDALYAQNGNPAGIIYLTDEQYANWENLTLNDLTYPLISFMLLPNGFLTESELSEREFLYYMVGCACGEYTAYQADADYLDSIAGDIYDSSASTGVNGAQEKSTIENHINDAYNPRYINGTTMVVEAIPDWKWWSYA